MGHKQTHLVINCMFVHLYVCLSLCVSVPVCVFLSVYLPICAFVCILPYIAGPRATSEWHDSGTIHPLLASTFLILDLSLVK